MSATLVLHPEREKSLLRRHPWVFEGAVNRIKGQCSVGDTVDIVSSKGKWLARGAFSPQSQIRARVWTFDKNESVDNAFFCRKIERCIAQRAAVVALSQTTGYRLVAGESDDLPGITVDVYANVVVVQLLSAGAEKQRGKILWALKRFFPDSVIHERSDVAVREKEGLSPVVETHQGELPREVTISEHGIQIIVDLVDGHKTGFYLDQRENRAIVGRYATGKTLLNCFCYTGTFASHALKAGATHVTNVDVSAHALATARRNLAINNLSDEQAEFVEKDVFNLLRDFRDEKRQFGVVVLDPPKFVDSKATLKRAARGYKDINLYGIQAVEPGGYLATFSCSGLMPADLFAKIVADAALDAKRDVKILQRLEQAPDHAVSSNYPEGYYLKGLLCQVW
ncbi:class I SAM-dependent rRNA methyltransferase [Alteromonas oceanisediminis]|uniref:class I SAM-dependent rRNA methyltransferase n=1 Tax=Alteromonas oceanisediminis TaxID=2836180 RepID=UPI001BDA20EF|nr:class I SAM-dependent methyltransferase [Alteromonas oceanisediminis]MBT0587225.1 class I SAM-dependent methyltransferase [Alteromonas oceanisediminis]